MRNFAALLILVFTSFPSHASETIEKYVPNAQIVGEGRLTVFTFDIYDARLYAPNGTFLNQPPFAIELSYLRNIDGKKIADQSAEEMRNLHTVNEIKLADWHTQMRQIFPDVTAGDSITGIYTHSDQCHFYKGPQNIGHINDAQFCSLFFDIWLSEETRSPILRKKLLGELKR